MLDGIYTDAQAQRGATAFAQSCAACHGADGNSADPHVPKFAGQISDYLYAQLRAYRKGSRKSEIMSVIVADLSDTDMATVASFYGRQQRKVDAKKVVLYHTGGSVPDDLSVPCDRCEVISPAPGEALLLLR